MSKILSRCNAVNSSEPFDGNPFKKPDRKTWMEQEAEQYYWQQNQEEASDSSIDDFIHGRSRILRTKLEVLAFEIHERLLVRGKNLERIGDDKTHITTMLIDLDRRAHYLARQHKEKAPFYEQLFKLEQERRLQDVECWRDVVMVMRDFLYVWEAHEMAKNKAILLDHV